MTQQPQIAVIDFGGQYAHLIAKRLRHLGSYTTILPADTSVDALAGLKGIILSGGPASVTAPNAPACDPAILEQPIPILGLCYGHQLIAHYLGGKVGQAGKGEYGIAFCEVKKGSPITEGFSRQEQVWMSHGDSVLAPPPDFDVVGLTADCPVAIMAARDKPIFGVQFHPEVKDSPCGNRLLQNFLHICQAEANWSMDLFLEQSITELKKKVGDKKVLFFLSGGVDSTVAFAILVRALGPEHVLGLYIDHGFMRLGETEEIKASYEKLNWQVKYINAAHEFFGATRMISDPQQKRAAIGDQFIGTRNRILEELNLDFDEWLLGQGTLYPDIIESGGTKHADTIKTHHNRSRGIEELIKSGHVVEPLSDLYKDEVRMLGKKLGLPEAIIWRHPFPGPGLAINVLCTPGPPKVDAIQAMCREQGYRSWLLPVKSVGVQGDQRTYTEPVAIQGPRDWTDLEKLSTQLTNSFREINRVVLLLTEGEPVVTLHEAYLCPERLDILRRADHVMTQALIRYDLMGEVFQHLTMCLPLGKPGTESIVLRPVFSEDVMTARFATLPWELVMEVTKLIKEDPAINDVYYDVTHKPPATFGWE